MVALFKVVSFLEGLSYILLLFIATPIKHLQGDETYVKMLGMPHGILFMLYIIIAYLLKDKFDWSNKTFGVVCLLSLIPFGTFFVHKYLKKEGE